MNMNQEKVCRTCLSATRPQLMPLSNKLPYLLGTQLSHLDCLRYCTKLKVPMQCNFDNFHYPQEICSRCSKALQVAFHFTRMAEDSEARLRKRMLQVGKKINLTMEVLEELDEPIEKSSESVKPTENRVVVSTQADEFIINLDEFLQNYDESFNNTTSEDTSLDINLNEVSATLHEEIAAYTTQNEVLNQNQDYLVNVDSNKGTLEISSTCADNNINKKEGVTDTKLKCNAAQQMLKDTETLQQAFENQETKLVNNNELVCKQCNEYFDDIQALQRHRNQHKGIKPIRCNSCNFFTCYTESMRKHYKKEHKIIATNALLNDVQHTTSLEKPYQELIYRCFICSFDTHIDSEMTAHLMNEHFISENLSEYILKEYNCTHCYRGFKDKKSLHTHFTLKHGKSMDIEKVSTETFVCPNCDKHFQFKTSLVTHQRFCQIRKAVDCHICSKQFFTMRSFEQHLRCEHNIETIHECEVCGRRFGNTEALSLHRKRHNERHFQCNQCSCNYINITELRTHIKRVHLTADNAKIKTLAQHKANQKRFKKFCKYPNCNYKSFSQHSIRLHQYLHKDKPYKCDICQKEFVLRGAMRRHAQLMHSVELSDEQLALMYRNKFGYLNRYDAFSKTHNSLEITEVQAIEQDVELELQEFGLKFDDIFNDLFKASINDNDTVFNA